MTYLFINREIKNFRAQYPGLRLSQLKEIMYKEFQKSPDNPFNQTNVFSYNTTIEEVNRKISKLFYIFFYIYCLLVTD